MTYNDDRFDDELEGIADRLRTNRPTATALELDAVKQRVLARSRRNREAPGFMRTRGAILVTLVLGFMVSTTGAGLAVSGFVVTGQASQAAYPTPPTPTTPTPTVPTNTGNQGDQAGEGEEGEAPENEVLGGTESGGGGGSDVQPTRQVEAGAQAATGSLPFTGFAAIPILLIGIALLSAGFVMRRSARAN